VGVVFALANPEAQLATDQATMPTNVIIEITIASNTTDFVEKAAKTISVTIDRGV